LDRFRIDRSRIRYLVVSHAHHDHCGAVPYLLRKHPWIEIVASAYAAEILRKEKPVRLMKDLNARTLERLGRGPDHGGIPLDFTEIPVAHPMDDGAELPLGRGLTMRFFDTPGHSRCSMSAYVPQLQALFPGDSVPYPEPGRTELTVTANHDFSDYLTSLEKLATLPIEIVGYEHGGALTGPDARGIIGRGQEAARRQRDRIRDRFRELGDLDALVAELAGKYQTLELFQLVPGEAMRAIVRRMVQSALERPMGAHG
jgi:glyoxylase-like metal-dependent hydrolase (beta-lactamase superfamily II)